MLIASDVSPVSQKTRSVLEGKVVYKTVALIDRTFMHILEESGTMVGVGGVSLLVRFHKRYVILLDRG